MGTIRLPGWRLRKRHISRQALPFANDSSAEENAGFFAVELRQNNELMAADTRFNRLCASTESYTLQAVDPDIAAILVKDKNGEPLTEVERPASWNFTTFRISTMLQVF